MIEMITKLDDKYIVVKREDINNYLKGNSRYHTEDGFYSYLNVISIHRKEDGKKDNRYVVLNLDDKISLAHLSGKLTELIHKRMLARLDEEKGTLHDVIVEPTKVKDIAVDIVNAILKAKGLEMARVREVKILVCSQCENRVSTCDMCGDYFKDNDKIECKSDGLKHYCKDCSEG